MGKQLKRFLALMTAFCMTLSIVAVPVSAEDDDDIIEIASAEDLVKLTKMDFAEISEATIVLTANINMAEAGAISPIGGEEPFNGTFDGQGHVIRNLTMSEKANKVFCTGLFGYVGLDGEVKNLGLQDVNINGYTNTGAIAGVLMGTVSQCYVTGAIDGGRYTGGIAGMLHAGTIEDCWVDATMVTTRYGGGLFGGTSYKTQPNPTKVESPVGDWDGPITDQAIVVRNNLVMGTNSGSNYASGLFGSMAGAAESSPLEDLTGNVSWMTSVKNSSNNYYGPIYAWWAADHEVTGDVEDNVYWEGMSLKGGTKTGLANSGIMAVDENGKVWDADGKVEFVNFDGMEFEAVTEAELLDQETYEDLGWDFDDVWMWNDELDHPVLQIFPAPQNEVDTIYIDSVEDFLDIWEAASHEAYSNDIIILRADLNMAGEGVIAPAFTTVPFNGTFDGNGHLIRNLQISGSGNCTGLFGQVGVDGEIYALGLDNVSVSGSFNTGAIAGVLMGSVSECYVTGGITGKRYTGGIAGMLHAGTIENCWVDAAMNTTNRGAGLFGGTDYKSRATSSTSTDSPLMSMGGPIIDQAMVIRNNLVLGSNSGTKFSGAFMADMADASLASPLESFEGNVSWVDSVTVQDNNYYGPLYMHWDVDCDDADATIANNLYWEGTTYTGNSKTGLANSTSWTAADCVPLSDMEELGYMASATAAELGDQATYEALGWDFDDVWYWDEDMGHPVLQAVEPPAVNKVRIVEIYDEDDFLDLCDPDNFEELSNDEIYLEADLDMSGEIIAPIGEDFAFNGLFDGQDHVIRNLTIEGVEDVHAATGLFGYVGRDGEIRNLGLDCVTVIGDTNTGAFAGALNGTLRECYAIGTVSGQRQTGGLVGMLHAGTIEDCWTDLIVTGSRHVGGIFGGTTWNNSSYDNSSSNTPMTGIITDKDMVIRNTLAIGTVSGTRYAGGVMGDMRSGKSSGLESFEGNVAWVDSVSISTNDTSDYFDPVYAWWNVSTADATTANNLYWDEMKVFHTAGEDEISATQTNCTTHEELGVSAATKEELGEQATYEALGWDFEGVWVWSEELGHPVLDGFEVPSKFVPGEQKTPASLVTTFADSPKTTRDFSWWTDSTVTESIVQVILTERYEDNSDFESYAADEFVGTCYERQVDAEGTIRNIHKVHLDGLEPGESYTYRAGDGKNWSPVYEFKTEPEDADSFTFFSFTDTQDQNKYPYTYYANGLELATDLYPEGAFIIHSGDVIQNNQTSDYDSVYSATREYTASLPSMVAPGNHELNKDVELSAGQKDALNYVKGVDNFNDHYTYPKTDLEGFGEGQTVYSFTYGDVYFAMLNSIPSAFDTYDYDKAYAITIEWLRQDVAEKGADKAWKIVAMHHGPYTTSGSVRSKNGDLIAALEELGFNLVMSGHDHTLYRSHSLLDGEKTEADEIAISTNGIIYYSAGAAVSAPGSASGSNFALKSNSAGDTTFGAITVTEDSLTLTTHSIPNHKPSQSSVVLDSVVIYKPDAIVATAPEAVVGLIENGEDQALITAGTAELGVMLYSLDGENYSKSIPMGNEAGTYTVYYKAGGVEHKDTEPEMLEVVIAPAIIDEDIAQVETTPAAADLVYTGNAQTLVIPGTAANGTMMYSIDGEEYTETIPTATEAGAYTVYYKVVGADGYADSEAATVAVTIAQKNIAGAAITLGAALTYNGEEQTQTVENVEIDGLTVTYDVTDNTATNVGTYTLIVTGTGNFTGTATAVWSIAEEPQASVETTPAAADLVYTGNAQTL
ncbi:MAG: metallophosphoesterase family protein, partial [Clostridia bacterium]|nr:metallophosphoesterase family protein [Clostridia bacterium]